MHDSGDRAVGLVKESTLLVDKRVRYTGPQSAKANKTTRAGQRQGLTRSDTYTGKTCTLEIRLEH